MVPGGQKQRTGPDVKPLTGIKKILQTKAACENTDPDKQAFVDFVQFVDKKIGSMEETDWFDDTNAILKNLEEHFIDDLYP